MQKQPLHESAYAVFARAFSPPNTTKQRPQDTCILLNEWQDTANREITLELIELRYQEHRAHMDLQALFAEGGLCCL